MAVFRRFLLQLHNFLRPGRAEQELAREMASHLSILEDEFQRRGMTPDEARAAARRAMGGVEQAKERHREARSLPLLEDLRRDLGIAARTLWKARGFTVVVILTLGAGIGGNTAIFTVVNALLIQPLPYPQPQQLVRIVEHIPAQEGPDGRPERRTGLTKAEADALRKSTTIADVGLYFGVGSSGTWTEEDQVRVVGTSELQPSVFRTLRLSPVLGRAFTEDDADAVTGDNTLPQGDPVAVLSWAAWHRYFGGDPSILGRTMNLNGRERAIVGVMPEAFAFPDATTEVWTPLVAASPAPLPYGAIARVRDGVSIEAAASEVRAIYAGLGRREGPGDGPRVEVVSVREEQAAPFRPALRVLLVAVVVVLLIACANVAHLLLARTTVRVREFGVRAALGAGRKRLVRQLLTESLLLASLGGAVGLALAYGGTSLLTAAWPGNVAPQSGLPRMDRIDVDTTVVAFTAIVTAVTGLLFGLVPALHISRTDLMAAIRDTPQTPGAHGRLFSTRGVLVVAETALAVVLVAAAGLLIHSFVKLATNDAGFTAARVLTFQIATSRETAARRLEMNDQLVDRIRALPGVAAAGYSLSIPLQTRNLVTALDMPRWPRDGEPARPPYIVPVNASYLEVIGAPLVAGRFFRPDDDRGAPVMILNESLAKKAFTGNAVGQLVRTKFSDAAWEVIGVVADASGQQSLADEPTPAFYVPAGQMVRLTYMQGPMRSSLWGGVTFAVRAERDPEALVPAINAVRRDLEPRSAITSLAPLTRIVSNSMAAPRFYAALVGTFAGLALALAAIGIYGLLAYSVAQRTREIGVRMALGAERRGILALVLGQGAVLAGIGMVAGLAGAFAVTRYLSSLLFGITPLDPATFVAVSLVFAGVALFASYMPARRATVVDPLVALRSE
ncbi:MAG TPA: ABC transporter permease [Vicinamibacterales bacterium]|nr:ABC transporter permease [Vicinamibacterales bacterium]